MVKILYQLLHISSGGAMILFPIGSCSLTIPVLSQWPAHSRDIHARPGDFVASKMRLL
jgi:hypothetical protein